MPRFLSSPVGGYGTWSAGSPDDPPPVPVRLQGERPTLELSSYAPVDVRTLPRGELTHFVLDDEPISLWPAALEDVTAHGRSAAFTVLLPEPDSPGDGHLLRLRVDLEDVHVEHRHRTLVPDRARLRTVESLQHDGDGGLRLAVYASPFGFLQLTAETLTVVPTWLDPRRPPHVKVMWDHGSFGIWDEGPGMGPFLSEELDLPPRLRDRIQAWCDRCEDGDEDHAEQDAIAAELRRAWPDSVVRVQR